MAETFIPFDPKKVPVNVIITGGTTSKTKQYQGTSLVDVVMSEPLVADQNKLLQDFEGFSANYRKSLSQKLKAAGYYRGTVTGKPTVKLQEAYLNAYSDLNVYTRQKFTALPGAAQQTNQVDNLESFLLKQDTGEGAGKGPTSTVQTKISTPLEGRELIDKVFKDLLGRGATKAEFDKYYTQVTKRQKAMPTTTTYSGGARNVVTQTGGPDVQEFLFQKIAGTDEAKSRKVFGFYDIFKQALGVD